jgi:uncharacterized membrane protein
MSGYILLSVLFIMLVMLTIMTWYLRTLQKKEAADDELELPGALAKKISVEQAQNLVLASLILVIIGVLISLYVILKGTLWEGHFMEWLNIVVRLMHFTFGIAWIGASFYFVFLENALNRTKDVRDELAGNLWAIHGGGFYYLEKYKVAPGKIPKHLHWFKYEAYFTWLSGFCLMFVVYYFNATALLIDKNVLDISPIIGISIGIGSMILAWFLYDLLCRTTLVKKGAWFALVGFIVSIAFAWFYGQVFSARAAYIHFGAMLGTLMAANVFFVIIPAQKAMVSAARNGEPLNPQLGKNAGLRSMHNNYFTLPVLFVMISNHFPSTFGYEYPWLVLAIITLGTAGVKHYLNLKEQGQLSVWVLPVSVIILLAGAFITAPVPAGACTDAVSFTQVNTIVQSRCVTCHSASPTDDFYTAPPNGIVYDTPDDMVKLKDKIMQRVVLTKTMPQNNKTNMTQKERDVIRCWIEQGATLK